MKRTELALELLKVARELTAFNGALPLGFQNSIDKMKGIKSSLETAKKVDISSGKIHMSPKAVKVWDEAEKEADLFLQKLQGLAVKYINLTETKEQ